MSKKNGTGCTTIALTLSKLLNKPLYVNSDSFLLEDSNFSDFKPEIKKITATKTDGIFDVGSQIERPLVKKIIKNSELIIIPMELGYETTVRTVETIRYVRSIKPNIAIVIILNKLNSGDSERDFNYKFEMINLLAKYKIEIYNDTIDFPNNNKVTLTYLRHSYLLYDKYENGEYFLDKYKLTTYEEKKKELRDTKEFDFRFLKYLASIEFGKVDYRDDEIYRQNKDMVLFRNDFSNKYSDNTLRDFEYDGSALASNKKLIKDMAYILYAIKYHTSFFYTT